MIHQLIFAHPKPGMGEREFQSYWVERHAPIAAQIPQIRRYLVALRLPFGPDPTDPPFSGVAEVWLENEEEQIASLQTPEYLQHARADEPNWAAFWQTLVLDTNSRILQDGSDDSRDSKLLKYYVLMKRKPGMSLADFRYHWHEHHSRLVLELPGLLRYIQCEVRDSLYALGESRFDAVDQWYFQDTEAIRYMMQSPQYRDCVLVDRALFLDDKYVVSFVAEETWIIGPRPRCPAAPAEPASLILGRQLLQAVEDDDAETVDRLLGAGAYTEIRDGRGLTALMIAAAHANAQIVERLLMAGADVFTIDARVGNSALHKACQGGSVSVARMLIDRGAHLDLPAPTTGHTPLMDAVWYKWPDLVELLLDHGVNQNLGTHYGFSMRQHLDFELNANAIGRDRLVKIDQLLKRRSESDEARIKSLTLIAAVKANNIGEVRRLIKEGAKVDEVYPIVNSFDDGYTALLIAARDGQAEIVRELLAAGANVNATDAIFKATPLHKATYNGNLEILQILLAQPKIDVNVQGPLNGYTPLHDALWHGYAECAKLCVEAGARLDLKGHDGKTPLDIAVAVFGRNGDIPSLIRSRMWRYQAVSERRSRVETTPSVGVTY